MENERVATTSPLTLPASSIDAKSRGALSISLGDHVRDREVDRNAARKGKDSVKGSVWHGPYFGSVARKFRLHQYLPEGIVDILWPRVSSLSGVNYFSLSATIRIPYRSASSQNQ